MTQSGLVLENALHMCTTVHVMLSSFG